MSNAKVKLRSIIYSRKIVIDELLSIFEKTIVAHFNLFGENMRAIETDTETVLDVVEMKFLNMSLSSEYRSRSHVTDC